MKLRNVSIFAVAAMVALSACGGDDEAAEGGAATDGTVVDTAMAAPAPLPVDTGMAAPMDSAAMPMDSAAMGADTMAGDTTKM